MGISRERQRSIYVVSQREGEVGGRGGEGRREGGREGEREGGRERGRET
jgi:hypothetical protein